MKIRDMMSRDVQVARPADTVESIAARMEAGDFGFMPVAGEHHIDGVLTDRDIAIRVIGAGKPASTSAAEAMTSPAMTVLDTDDLKSALDAMARSRIRRLPVIDIEGRLVGIVSLGDLAGKVRRRFAGDALETISRPS